MNDFGNYRILEEIGRGGMARVFKAEEISLKRMVAIKVIRDDFADDKAFVKMFKDEAVIAANLNHPDIVSIYELGAYGGSYYISMEFVQGKSLAEIIERTNSLNRRIPLGCVMFIVSRVAGALQFAHSKNVIHRDVNPSNIMISDGGDVKLADFGIARAASLVSSDTKTGTLKGKVSYLSPEQASGRDVDWRADIFALGTIVYELVTGKKLFAGVSDSEILEKLRGLHIADEIAGAGSGIDGFPDELRDVMRRCLSRKKGDRYQALSVLRSDIDKLAGRCGFSYAHGDVAEYTAKLFCGEGIRSPDAPSLMDGTRIIPAGNNKAEAGRHKKKNLAVIVSVSAAVVIIACLAGRKKPDLRDTSDILPSASVTKDVPVSPGKADTETKVVSVSHIENKRTEKIQGNAVPQKNPAEKGMISVSVQPHDAVVWVDNVIEGEGDRVLNNLILGNHIVKIVHPDYEDEIRIIDLTPDRAMVRLLYRDGEIEIKD